MWEDVCVCVCMNDRTTDDDKGTSVKNGSRSHEGEMQRQDHRPRVPCAGRATFCGLSARTDKYTVGKTDTISRRRCTSALSPSDLLERMCPTSGIPGRRASSPDVFGSCPPIAQLKTWMDQNVLGRRARLEIVEPSLRQWTRLPA